MGKRHSRPRICQRHYEKYRDYQAFKYELMHRYDRDGRASAEDFCRKCGRHCRRWQRNEGQYVHQRKAQEDAIDAQIRMTERMHSGYGGMYGIPPAYYGSMQQYSNDYYQTQDGYASFLPDPGIINNESLVITMIIIYLLIAFICLCATIFICLCTLTKKLKPKVHEPRTECTV